MYNSEYVKKYQIQLVIEVWIFCFFQLFSACYVNFQSFYFIR